jgi:hypothetical protein
MKHSLAHILYPANCQLKRGTVLKRHYSYLWLSKYLRIDVVFGYIMFVKYTFYAGDHSEIYDASGLEPLY